MESRNKHYKEEGKLDIIQLFKLTFPKANMETAFLLNIFKYNFRSGKKKSIATDVINDVLSVIENRIDKGLSNHNTNETNLFATYLIDNFKDEFAHIITKYDELQRLQDIEKMNDYINELKQLDSDKV